MTRRRLLIAGAFFVLVVSVLVVWLATRDDKQAEPALVKPTTTSSVSTLTKENIELLQKLGSANEQERLQALAPTLRESGDIKAALQANPVTVQILPETFRVDNLEATVEAQLTGSMSERVTFYLQPSDGLWRILARKR